MFLPPLFLLTLAANFVASLSIPGIHSVVDDGLEVSSLSSDAICKPIPLAVLSAADAAAKRRAEPATCPDDRSYYIFNPASESTFTASDSILPRQAGGTVEDYSCGPSKPCSNGACCAKTGYCGYGPASCGDGTTPNDNCWSNCDATAECGRYAATPGTKCPLNVCCSQFGFCGMTDEFCATTDNVNTTCQSNCDQPGSGSSGGDVQSRLIGYYEAWNWAKNCVGMKLQDIPVSSITHLHYAFAYITPDDYQISPMDNTVPNELFSQITALKSQNPDLKVIVSIGGWSCTYPSHIEPPSSICLLTTVPCALQSVTMTPTLKPCMVKYLAAQPIEQPSSIIFSTSCRIMALMGLTLIGNASVEPPP